MFNFHIPGPLEGRMRAEADRTGLPLSEVVRRALDEYLERREKGPANGSKSTRQSQRAGKATRA